jgi:hypothetical protein
MSALVSDRQRRVSIFPWKAQRLSELDGEAHSYDALLASVGYEPRCRAITKGLGTVPTEAVAVEFEHTRPSSYDESLQWFADQGVRTSREWAELFLPWFRGWLLKIAASQPGARIAVDISSMNRPRIAAVVQALAELPMDVRISVDLLYAPSRFSPPHEHPDGVLTLRPVSSYLGGQLGTQTSPVALIGLGYEPHKANAALEGLEIRSALAYVPVGPHRDFRDAVLKTNRGLLGGPEQHPTVNYEVLDPFDCIARLDGRVHALLGNGDVPAIIPLGPKIFALCACLVAAIHHPRVSVWRASFDKEELPIKRLDEGWVCGVTVTLAPAFAPMDDSESQAAPASVPAVSEPATRSLAPTHDKPPARPGAVRRRGAAHRRAPDH